MNPSGGSGEFCNQRILAAAVAEAAGQNDALRLKLGVASISQVPNRFDSARLVAAALGCLNATLVAGATSVKSIEVY